MPLDIRARAQPSCARIVAVVDRVVVTMASLRPLFPKMPAFMADVAASNQIEPAPGRYLSARGKPYQSAASLVRP